MEEFLDEYIIDGTEDLILKNKKGRQDVLDKLKIVPAKKKRKKKDEDIPPAADGETESFIQTVKRCATLLSDDDEDGKPAKKKMKLSEEDKTMGEAYMKFNAMKNAELQDILGWNNVAKTGNKTVLLTRVIDGYLHGRIAKCFSCKKGQPKISDDGTHIICNGYYDTDRGFRLSCGSKSKIKDVKR